MNVSCVCRYVEYRLFYRALFAKETYNFKEPINRTRCVEVTTHKNKSFYSCSIWMSNLAYKWVIYSFIWDMIDQSSHVCMCSVTHQWITFYMNESPHISPHVSISLSRKLNHVTHIYEWFHIWMNHVPYEWVISHINGSFLISTHHLSYNWVLLQNYESSLTWRNHFPYEWVISHTNGPFRISTHHLSYNWVLLQNYNSSLTWMRHVTYKWVMSHKSLSEVKSRFSRSSYTEALMWHDSNESCHIRASYVTWLIWVMSHKCAVATVYDDLENPRSSYTEALMWHDSFLK